MLPFGVTIPATVTQGSEIPEGLVNNPVQLVAMLTGKYYIFLLCTDYYPTSLLDIRVFETQRDVRSKNSNSDINEHLYRW
jgi:hypothetical protein